MCFKSHQFHIKFLKPDSEYLESYQNHTFHYYNDKYQE